MAVGVRRALASALLLAHAASGAATLLTPAGDDEVVEILPAVTVGRPVAAPNAALAMDPIALAGQVRAEIALARQTGDTRYWGRAQAQLGPWWDKPAAPPDLAVLQATVLQGRHAFDAARQVLSSALARAPGHAQGWLNLASLERLQGHYDAALRSCDAVARAGAMLYAQACQWETASLQGRQSSAERGLRQLADSNPDKGQQAWLLSLLAESLERSGQDALALQSYRRSLALEPDLYTAIALSDLLLRTGQPAQALALLAPLPQTDAVLLRRATALRRKGDAQWRAMRAELRERTAELRRRGDDLALHGRELALIALWLDDDAAGALAMARRNLALQREPVDWWIALHSARMAKDMAVLAQIETERDATGLRDRRLDAVQTASVRLGNRP